MMKRTIPPFAAALVALLLVGLVAPVGAVEKAIRIGRMWDQWGDIGRGGWGGPGMMWPGGFWPSSPNRQKQTTPFHGHVAGVKNWKDAAGKFFPFAVAQADIRGGYTLGYDTITGSINLIHRRSPPKVVLDGRTLPGETPDKIDPNIPSDGMLVCQWRDALGLSFTQNVYAYVNTDFADGMPVEFFITNSGKGDAPDPNKVNLPNQNLEGLFFGVDAWFNDRGEEGRIGGAAEGTGDGIAEFYGKTYPRWVAGDRTADSLRVMFGYDGDSRFGAGANIDDIGDPDVVGLTGFELITGRLLSAKFPGIAVLHAPKAWDNPSDWPEQPTNFNYVNFNNFPRRTQQGDQAVYEFYAKGTPDKPSHKLSQREVQAPGLPFYQGVAKTQPQLSSTDFAPVSCMAVGPYDLPFNRTLRVVMAYAVGGMDYQRTLQVGGDWMAKKISDAAKDEIVAAYRDTLFGVIGRMGIAASEGDYKLADGTVYRKKPFDVPDSPPPPDVTVTSGPAQITVEWSDVSGEVDPDTKKRDFKGYRVYRAEGSFFGDAPFVKVYETTNSTDRKFVDTNVLRGFSYHYYVTAFDDGTQNYLRPGVSLESSIHDNRTSRAGIPFRPETTPIRKGVVRVVPNPWDARDPVNHFGKVGQADFEKILFVNIPGKCTIKIYTEVGDLVKVISHTSGSGDESWDQVTDFNQKVVSGIYLAVIEGAGGGNVDVVKFVVIR